ncbi:MAG: biotin transporter BioY [Candidatus Omnitrophica bacterium]|nr:biotin transporter BioY [Candidatus Omnitrophota bacterium]MDD5430275.1 biotin transporter BioY [Candidatus Omnitrophota bacterium]
MREISLTYNRSLCRQIAGTFAFTILMVLAASVRIPLFFTPVPLTLQTLIVFLSIAALGRGAVFSQALYLILGFSGLPVFTNGGSGLMYLMGPTGGYLLGFVFVALIMPYFLPKERSFLKMLVFFTMAFLGIYFLGVNWLVFVYKLSLPAALAAGFYPFIPVAAMKITIASAISLKY